MTKASWEELQRLSKEIDFVLIGGWATFLWTGKHKSKDIDIVVSLDTLSELKQHYGVAKNERLKKYEIKRGDFDIDIYAPYFSELIPSPQEILEKHHTRIQGIRVVSLEALLVLKQAAYADRRGSVKGMKDEIDLVTLLYYAEPDWNRYLELLAAHGKKELAGQLARLVKDFDPKALDYLGIPFKEFRDWQKRETPKLRRLQT